MSVKVRWMDSFPDSWGVVPSKRLFSESKKRAHPDDEQLTASQDYGVIPQKEFIRRAGRRVVQITQHLDKRKFVERDDFVISMRSFQGGLERAWASGGIRSSYVVLKPSLEVEIGYFAQLFKSQEYIRALQATSHFIRDGQDLNFQNFTLVDLPLPPIEEQTQIAKFLDHETAKIDALIEKQQQLIALLQEKRQAVISHAVTKGLNPDVPMRDSGVEWLGEVPAHWVVGKCGFYLDILSGFAFPSAGFGTDEDDIRLLRGINVGVGKIRWDETVRWRRSPGDGLEPYELADGDLVIGMDRPVISEGIRVAKIGLDDLPCLLLQRVASLKTSSLLCTDYFMHLLSSDMFEAHFSPETTGVSVPHISPAQIANYVIPVPPIGEQAQIVAEISRQVLKIESLIQKADKAVVLLQERRTALISAAVTGKIDVRNWQAGIE